MTANDIFALLLNYVPLKSAQPIVTADSQTFIYKWNMGIYFYIAYVSRHAHENVKIQRIFPWAIVASKFQPYND